MAQFRFLPEVVIYSEFGVEHKALVVGSRTVEHHAGENDEPMLNLVIVKPVVLDECVKCHFPERNHGKPYPPGASHRPCDSFEGIAPVASVNPAEYIHIQTDVPHESHKFTEEQILALQKQGLTAYPGGALPGGRWREVDAGGIPIPPVVAIEDGAIEVPQVESASRSTPATGGEAVPEGEKTPPTVQ